MKIGLSYDQGTPKYRLYVGALMAAAERANIEVQPFWLAGTEHELDRTALATIDALILTGGADVEPARYGFNDSAGICRIAPGRDAAELEMLDSAFERRLPILAICRGLQLLNVYRGGTLVPHLESTDAHRLDDGARHDVQIGADTALALLAGATRGQVTSSHHQAIGKLGDGLREAARHADGTVEAIEWVDPLRNPWLTAIQWHPERMDLNEPFAGAIYRGFLQAVAAAHG